MQGQLREIACDESGYEGEKLAGGVTDVFAHAGVDLTAGSAADCVRELRRRIRSPALEYKANHLLREKHRSVLVWLLGPRGPLPGHARVYLVDKSFLLVDRVVARLVEAPPDIAARILYGERSSAGAAWAAFLAASNDLLRDRTGTPAGTESFRRAVEALRIGASPAAGRVLDRLRLCPLRAPSPDSATTALDLLVPALVRAVTGWSDGGRVPVAVVHDRQTALTDERLAQVRAMLGGTGGRLAGLRLVDSRSDPRVQVADFLAGVARKVASEVLAGHGDAELVALLRPYVDPSSIWGDDRSWAVLGPAGQAC